jgi:DNA end-binding protein Ku
VPELEPQDELDEVGRGRPIWSGTVTFGLVSVPVNILPANASRRVALHMVADDGRPLSRRYFRARDNRQLTQDDIVRGYEVKKGKYVVLDDDELERLMPERTRDIDLRQFAKVSELDPIYFERAYFLTPVGSAKAYRLLARTMEESELAGIATFVMRAKEYLTAILAENGILRAQTLRFADEIRDPKTIGLPTPARPSPAAVKRVETSIKRLTKTALNDAELTDRGNEKLQQLAKRKAKQGEDVVKVELPEDEPQGNVVDLMERLRESLKNGREVRARKRA